jgi:hypothetical protein
LQRFTAVHGARDHHFEHDRKLIGALMFKDRRAAGFDALLHLCAAQSLPGLAAFCGLLKSSGNTHWIDIAARTPNPLSRLPPRFPLEGKTEETGSKR